MDILSVCRDPRFFARWFKSPETWRAWRTFLKVQFGLAMDAADVALYRECTGRNDIPSAEGYQESFLICGRRAGKSIILALIAAYVATFRDWTPYLSPGERATLVVIAADRRQARVIFKYIAAFLKNVDVLATLIERETADTIELSNMVSIEIHTASFKTTRGYTLIGALLDEAAFWSTDEGGANPDKEILAALRPAMSTIPDAMLFVASSPYARRGILWDAHRRYFAKDGAEVLVWQAPTRTMNPTVRQRVVDEAYELDPAAAAAEYGAQFRTDVETFISREVIEACVVKGRFELAPVPGVTYFCAVDAAGGSGQDSFAAAIAHKVNDTIVIDSIREIRPRFDPTDAIAEVATLAQSYGIRKVFGDNWGGGLVKQPFRTLGIEYGDIERNKSQIYYESLGLLNARGKLALLDHQRCIDQAVGLERRTARGGKDSIDHAPGQHDDVINVTLAAALLANTERRRGRLLAVGVGGDQDNSASWNYSPDDSSGNRWGAGVATSPQKVAADRARDPRLQIG
jgi:hypothetical protein